MQVNLNMTTINTAIIYNEPDDVQFVPPLHISTDNDGFVIDNKNNRDLLIPKNPYLNLIYLKFS